VSLSEQKLRGGYYTPKEVAEVLVKWSIKNKSTYKILEPSCGDGVFLKSLNDLFKKSAKRFSITGIELNKAEFLKSKRLLSEGCFSSSSRVINRDFFKWFFDSDSDNSFDCVLGNPPFIRYQLFPEPSRGLAMKLLAENGFKANRLTNMWVPFIVGAISKLKYGGSLAMVVPAELLQVTYANQIRVFLANTFETIDIIGLNNLVFSNAEQEVVLLLAQNKKKKDQTLASIDLRDFESIEDLQRSTTSLTRPNIYHKHIEHESEKWLKYFLAVKEIELMRILKSSKRVTEFSTYGSIDVGIVTGNNSFFILTPNKAKDLKILEYCSPIVGRTKALKGSIFSKSDFDSLDPDSTPSLLLDLLNCKLKHSPHLKGYLSQGQTLNVHKGYKCSIRKSWYEVPSVWKPDFFLFRQIYDFPRIVKNLTPASTTDTIHRGSFRSNIDQNLILSNCFNYMFAASAEIEGRSYGGGVLELEPTEAEKLLVPSTLSRCAVPLAEIDCLIRKGRLGDILEKNSELILREDFGLSKSDLILLKGIWNKLRQRRSSRKSTQGTLI